MQRLSVVFQGSVQGVGFRATACHVASGLPVSGWVRNQPDGSVELEVQGSREDIDGFLEGLRQRLGRYIRSERATAISPVAEESGFEIRRW